MPIHLTYDIKLAKRFKKDEHLIVILYKNIRIGKCHAHNLQAIKIPFPAKRQQSFTPPD